MEGMRCVKCNGTAKKAKLTFQGIEIDGWRCKCGEEYFDPAQAERILLLNKLKDESFEVTLGKSRSNLIIRIPAKVQAALDLKKGKTITLRVEDAKKLGLVVT
ncbi:MAG: AbrB/MazE/SpoVT family DNA-binding domain-containing protein [Candidatus Hydrothermarchaeales archaeon]